MNDSWMPTFLDPLFPPLKRATFSAAPPTMLALRLVLSGADEWDPGLLLEPLTFRRKLELVTADSDRDSVESCRLFRFCQHGWSLTHRFNFFFKTFIRDLPSFRDRWGRSQCRFVEALHLPASLPDDTQSCLLRDRPGFAQWCERLWWMWRHIRLRGGREASYVPSLSRRLHVVGDGHVLGPDVILPLFQPNDARQDVTGVDANPHVDRYSMFVSMLNCKPAIFDSWLSLHTWQTWSSRSSPGPFQPSYWHVSRLVLAHQRHSSNNHPKFWFACICVSESVLNSVPAISFKIRRYVKHLTSAASSNLPKRSLRVSTNLSTTSVVVRGVKLQMSAKRMLTFSCFSTNSSLKGRSKVPSLILFRQVHTIFLSLVRVQRQLIFVQAHHFYNLYQPCLCD